jgi:hypothetical protein
MTVHDNHAVPDEPRPPAPAQDAPSAKRPWPPWTRRLVWAAAIVAVLILAYFILGAFLPRWWAHRIGDQVDGSMAAGVGLGLFYGFVFTFLPLLVLGFVFRRRRRWRTRVWLAIGALVLAIPNLLTLGIVLGTGSSAHAGERTLDVEAPDFRAATLAGAILGLLAFLALRWLLYSRRQARAREDALREELKARDAARAPTEGDGG